jgi:hypothetical protein
MVILGKTLPGKNQNVLGYIKFSSYFNLKVASQPPFNFFNYKHLESPINFSFALGVARLCRLFVYLIESTILNTRPGTVGRPLPNRFPCAINTVSFCPENEEVIVVAKNTSTTIKSSVESSSSGS